MGKCEARIGRSRTGHYLWCRCIHRGIWAASLSVRLLEASLQRRAKPGASTLSILSPSCPGIPFLLSRSRVLSLLHMQLLAKSSANCNAGFNRQYQVFLIFFFFKYTFLSCLFWWWKLVLLRSDAGSCLCFLRLNRKAPVQRIRSARRRITNAGQTRHESREQCQIFFFLSWKGIISTSQNRICFYLLLLVRCLQISYCKCCSREREN